MDRFNLQIQIATQELKLRELERAKDGLEVKIAHELKQLAQLRYSLGRGGSLMPPEPAAAKVNPVEQRDLTAAHLVQRGYACLWINDAESMAASVKVEYWLRDENDTVLLVTWLDTDKIPSRFKMFIDSHRVPAEALP